MPLRSLLSLVGPALSIAAGLFWTPARAQGPCGGMTIHVLGESHTPIQGATAEWFSVPARSDSSRALYVGRTDARGIFVLSSHDHAIGVGEYRIRVTATGREARETRLFCASASHSEFTVYLPRAPDDVPR